MDSRVGRPQPCKDEGKEACGGADDAGRAALSPFCIGIGNFSSMAHFSPLPPKLQDFQQRKQQVCMENGRWATGGRKGFHSMETCSGGGGGVENGGNVGDFIRAHRMRWARILGLTGGGRVGMVGA